MFDGQSEQMFYTITSTGIASGAYFSSVEMLIKTLLSIERCMWQEGPWWHLDVVAS